LFFKLSFGNTLLEIDLIFNFKCDTLISGQIFTMSSRLAQEELEDYEREILCQCSPDKIKLELVNNLYDFEVLNG